MNSLYAVGLSNQAIAVYKLLIQHGVMSAKDMSEHLQIKRHNVYRITTHLLSYGLIEKIKGYPVRFQAKQYNDGRNNYLAQHGEWFTGLFSGLVSNNYLNQEVVSSKIFDISFFQSRDDHIEQQTLDVNNAKISIKYIAVTLPAGVTRELMLAYTRAFERDVELKLITQEYSSSNAKIIDSYIRNGAQVRYGKYIGWHLILIDDEISYILMIDPENKALQTGVRLVHKGINNELQGVFEKYWTEAEEI